MFDPEASENPTPITKSPESKIIPFRPKQEIPTGVAGLSEVPLKDDRGIKDESKRESIKTMLKVAAAVAIVDVGASLLKNNGNIPKTAHDVADQREIPGTFFDKFGGFMEALSYRPTPDQKEAEKQIKEVLGDDPKLWPQRVIEYARNHTGRVAFNLKSKDQDPNDVWVKLRNQASVDEENDHSKDGTLGPSDAIPFALKFLEGGERGKTPETRMVRGVEITAPSQKDNNGEWWAFPVKILRSGTPKINFVADKVVVTSPSPTKTEELSIPKA